MEVTRRQESPHSEVTITQPQVPNFVRDSGLRSAGLHSLLGVAIGVACCSCSYLFDEKENQNTQSDANTPDAVSIPDAPVLPSDAIGEVPIQSEVIQIANGTHDALQDPGGPVLVNYGWITLNSNSHYGGLYFSLDKIEHGVEIVSAQLEVYVDSIEESSPALNIYCQASANHLPFEGSNSNISNRQLTTEYKEWRGQSIGEGWQPSPELSAVIQEVFDSLPSGQSLQSLVFILDPIEQSASNRFEIRQFDFVDSIDQGEFSARLHLSYRPQS